MSTADSKYIPSQTAPKTIEIVSDSLAFGVVFAIALTVIQRGIGFLRGILFCRMMTEQELGQWSMVFSFLMLLAPFAVLGLPGSFGRYVEHYLQRGQLATFIRRIAKISCILTGVLAGTMYLAPTFFSELIFRSASHVGVVHSMAFAILMVASSNFLCCLMESLRQVRLATLMRFTQGIAFAIFGTLLIATWHDTAAAATFGFGVACSLCCIPALWFLWRHKNGLADTGQRLSHTDMWKRIAPYAIWTWASNLVCNMFEVSDRYMIVHWSRVAADEAHGFVGQYHSGRVLPLLLVGIAIVLEGMLMPYLAESWEQNRKEKAGRQITLTLKLIAIGFTLCSVVIVLFAPLLFDLVLGGRYDDGLAVLPLTLVYSIWFSLFLVGQVYLWVAERGKHVFVVTTAGLILNLLLNAALIPALGLWGAVIATSIATLFCLVSIILCNKRAGCNVDVRIWVTCSLPLIVFLPAIFLLAAATLIMVLAWRSTILLDDQEKLIASDRIRKLMLRFGSASG